MLKEDNRRKRDGFPLRTFGEYKTHRFLSRWSHCFISTWWLLPGAFFLAVCHCIVLILYIFLELSFLNHFFSLILWTKNYWIKILTSRFCFSICVSSLSRKHTHTHGSNSNFRINIFQVYFQSKYISMVSCNFFFFFYSCHCLVYSVSIKHLHIHIINAQFFLELDTLYCCHSSFFISSSLCFSFPFSLSYEHLYHYCLNYYLPSCSSSFNLIYQMLYSFAKSATKYHILSGLSNKTLFSHSFGS